MITVYNQNTHGWGRFWSSGAKWAHSWGYWNADRPVTVVEYSESFVCLFGPLPEVVTREVTRGVVTMLTARIKGITDTGRLKFQILLLNGAVTNKHSWCLLPFLYSLNNADKLKLDRLYHSCCHFLFLLRNPSFFFPSFPTNFEFFLLLLFLRVRGFKPCMVEIRQNTIMKNIFS
jgi:hypothetical protein